MDFEGLFIDLYGVFKRIPIKNRFKNKSDENHNANVEDYNIIS